MPRGRERPRGFLGSNPLMPNTTSQANRIDCNSRCSMRWAGSGSWTTAQQPYFVMLGTIEPRKNHKLILELWLKLHGDRVTIHASPSCRRRARLEEPGHDRSAGAQCNHSRLLKGMRLAARRRRRRFAQRRQHLAAPPSRRATGSLLPKPSAWASPSSAATFPPSGRSVATSRTISTPRTAWPSKALSWSMSSRARQT